MSVQTHGLLPCPFPCLYKPMVFYPAPPLYRSMVSYPGPPRVWTVPWSLTQPLPLLEQTYDLSPSPPPAVCTNPWSLTLPLPLPLQVHGLLPSPSTSLDRPMVSSSPSPPKSGSQACTIVFTSSLLNNSTPSSSKQQ